LLDFTCYFPVDKLNFSSLEQLKKHPINGAWLSLVEHCFREAGVGGSNPLAPTKNMVYNMSFISIKNITDNILNYRKFFMPKGNGTFLKGILSGFVIFSLLGCASSKYPTTHPLDPYEHFNRKVFAFNMAVDRAFFRPIVKVYDKVLPWPVKKGVRNFFGNIGDVTSAANEILQLHFGQAVTDIARVAINTTLGIGGLIDVAEYLGLEKDKEDFGITLARWGSKKTPYLVLPFLGSSTIRDLVGLPVDYYFLSVWPFVNPNALRYGLQAGNAVQRRDTLLPGDKIVDEAFDPYVFIRDAYLQRRGYLVKESEEEHTIKYVDDRGICHRSHRSIRPHSVLSN
jgi:phospholipid-binding lipoprotein MlaA